MTPVVDQAYKMPALGAMLPEILAAENAFNEKVDNYCDGNCSEYDLTAAVRTFNVVLERACNAAWEDTKHVNSRSTLQTAFAPRHQDPYSTWFGMWNPYRYLHGCAVTGSFNKNVHPKEIA